VRVQDLRSTEEEAGAFFTATMGLQLAQDAVSGLEERTEGWIAGLQLTALSLQGYDAGGVAEFIEAFSGSHRYVNCSFWW
jgi:LuxR family maltose regulon positive regulatory protein